MPTTFWAWTICGPLSFIAQRRGGPIPLYADARTTAVLEQVFSYTFSPDATYPTRARVNSSRWPRNVVMAWSSCAFRCCTARCRSNGYRFGNAAYMTDVSAIPESSFALLRGVEVLVLSALRHTPHPSHATLEQSLKWAQRIGARQTWFTHIAHDLGHEETNRNCHENAKLAYDGLSVPVTL
jgi:phosphoribosyl 1,2-cyclic phosphate phosphodiesterase